AAALALHREHCYCPAPTGCGPMGPGGGGRVAGPGEPGAAAPGFGPGAGGGPAGAGPAPGNGGPGGAGGARLKSFRMVCAVDGSTLSSGTFTFIRGGGGAGGGGGGGCSNLSAAVPYARTFA